jgi:prefoldin subunit 5
MEKELNYLSNKIEILEGKIETLETNKKNYTTTTEINFYVSKTTDMKEEKEVLENILNALTINELK